MEEALAQLRKEYAATGRLDVFTQLSRFLYQKAGSGDYGRVAEKLGMSPDAMAMAVCRLRQRYRECVRLELGQTVTSPEALEEEMKELFVALTA